MKDELCDACQGITSGDCGRHGPWTTETTMTPPTALTPEEQALIASALSNDWGTEKDILAIIRRLDDMLMATQQAAVEQCTALERERARLAARLVLAEAEIDKLAPTVLALDEEQIRLKARVGELEDQKSALWVETDRRIREVMEQRDALALALEDADKTVSVVHDFVHQDGSQQPMNDAIWKIHGILRTALAQVRK